MKALFLTTLLAAAAIASISPAAILAHAYEPRANCKLSNAGGCVKYGTNGWIEFCPAEGAEQIDPADGTDKDCVSIRPFQFSEFNSAFSGTRHVVKQSNAMSFVPAGGIGREFFGTDCSDISRPCAVGTKSIEAIKVSVSLATSDESKLFIDMFIFSEGGTIRYDGTDHKVDAGSFKFDIRSDKYSFVNANCDSVAFDIEMRTLYGLSSVHEVSRGSAVTTIDSLVASPNRYTFKGPSDASHTWSNLVAVFTERANTAGGRTPVISFEIQGFKPYSSFIVDPFVTVPKTVHPNGASGALTVSASMVASCALALMVALLGAL